jgi:hypothetical protein
MTTVTRYLVTFLVPSAGVLLIGLALQVVPALVRQRSFGLPGLDGVRVEATVVRYGWWLSWLGARRDQRAALVTGLRADLTESARQVGGRVAVRRLGALRPAARDAVAAEDERTRRPRPGWGLIIGTVAAAATLAVELLMATAWWTAAEASGADVSGALPLFWDSRISWSTSHGASLASGPGYALVFLLVALVTARPWRLRRPPRPARRPA